MTHAKDDLRRRGGEWYVAAKDEPCARCTLRRTLKEAKAGRIWWPKRVVRIPENNPAKFTFATDTAQSRDGWSRWSVI